jgi:hypothetical protein
MRIVFVVNSMNSRVSYAHKSVNSLAGFGFRQCDISGDLWDINLFIGSLFCSINIFFVK